MINYDNWLNNSWDYEEFIGENEDNKPDGYSWEIPDDEE